jgi:hypothetical protein
MDHILAMAGLTAVALLTVYILKIIDNYYYEKEIGTELSEKVYRSARAFAHGGSDDEIRGTLINSLDFNEEEIEEVLAASNPHRNDNDGGYQAFLEAAEKVLTNY